MNDNTKIWLALAALILVIAIILGWQAGYTTGADIAERDNAAATEGAE